MGTDGDGGAVTASASARPRAVDVIFAIAGVVAIGALAWHHMAILGDGFCSVATGRWLLATRALPTFDPFSYASAAGRWMIDSAGRCALFAVVDRAVGLRGLMMFGAAVEALAVGLLLLRAARTTTARLALLPLALFFVQIDAEDLSARGQLFGDLGFVLLLGVLARLRDAGRVPFVLVVLLAAAWTNLHLSFLIAIVLPLGAGVLLVLDGPDARPPVRPFLVASALALIGTLLTPYGPRYLPFALGFALDAGGSRLDLHRSPPFHDPVWLVAPAVGLAVVVLRGRYGAPRARRAEQAFLLIFVAAACTARRYATELVAVEMGLLGAMLDAKIDRLDPIAILGRAGASVRRTLAGRAFVPAAAGAALLLVATPWLAEAKDPLRDAPVAGAAVAREAHQRQLTAGKRFDRVADPLHWGGYLAYAWNGDPPYLVDGRDHLGLFGNGVFADSSTLWNGAAGWSEVLDVYEAGTVLWERGAPLDRLLRQDARWRLVYEDPLAVVYVRAE